MVTVVVRNTKVVEGRSACADVLAERLLEGARRLEGVASGLTDEQWNIAIPRDGRRVGVVVHHVASVYPIEVELARSVAKGNPITGLTMDDIHAMNAAHAIEFAGVTKVVALELLRLNSASAAAAIREFSDKELDRAVPVSLYSDAPLTARFVLEDHPVRHSFHHLERIRQALKS